jgi:hypothetical protein
MRCDGKKQKPSLARDAFIPLAKEGFVAFARNCRQEQPAMFL